MKIKKPIALSIVLIACIGSLPAWGMNSDFGAKVEVDDLETSINRKLEARKILTLLKKLDREKKKTDINGALTEEAKGAKGDLVRHVTEVCNELTQYGYNTTDVLDAFVALDDRIFKIALKYLDPETYFRSTAIPKSILFMPVYYNSEKGYVEHCGIKKVGSIPYLLPTSVNLLDPLVAKTLEAMFKCKKDEKGVTWFVDTQNVLCIDNKNLVIFPFIADKNKYPQHQWNKLKPDPFATHVDGVAKEYSQTHPGFFAPTGKNILK